MTSKSAVSRTRIATAIMAALLAMPAISTAQPVSAPTPVWAYPPQTAVFGMTYGDWSAAWWQWVAAIPADRNPATQVDPPAGGKNNCSEGQGPGPVFFLAGLFSPQAQRITRVCDIPAGKALLVPVINSECSSAEGNGDTEAALRVCAAGSGDIFDLRSMRVTLDRAVLDSLAPYRAQSPAFNLKFPKPPAVPVFPVKDEAAQLAGGISVADGYWVMIKPLDPGAHTLRFEARCLPGVCGDFFIDVTYRLNVLP